MISCFSASLSELEAATSKLASIREAVTFACWPPGPEERDARSSISRSGIAVRTAQGHRVFHGRADDDLWPGCEASCAAY